MEGARQFGSVVLVFALLAALVWSARRGGLRRWLPGTSAGRQAQGPLAVVARLALTPQHAVHLVRCRDRDLLVATHAQGCSLLIDVGAGKERA